MILEAIKSEGLAHYSYMVGDDSAGVAVVIDPRRDIDVYLDLAQKHSVRIVDILETHIHADFVSGSCELAAQTGATIHVGAEGEYGFDHHALQDGDEIEVGQYTLQAIHTPGHTPEHICYLIRGGTAAEKPWGLFSGDTLFAGEVGRPDLLGKGSEEKLARQLFHSLHDKILSLPGDIILYPGHGEGSPCGASIGSRATSTIGYEKRNNPLLQVDDEAEFVQKVMDSLSPAPEYYPRMKKINAAGPEILGDLPRVPALTADAFESARANKTSVVVDAREIEAYGGAHIENAINIALRSSFPIWAGRILQPKDSLLLLLPEDSRLEEAVRHLIRVGLDNIGGYLRQGMRSWFEAGKPIRHTYQMSIQELKTHVSAEKDSLQIVDVRDDGEWQEDRIPKAIHIFVPDLPEEADRLDREKPVAVYCGSGYRASIAASLLERQGFKEVSNIPGSITAWKQAGYPLETGEEE